jgi:hypothetical protein
LVTEYQLGRLRFDFDLTLSCEGHKDARYSGFCIGDQRGLRNAGGSLNVNLDDSVAVAGRDMLVQIAEFVQLPKGMRLQHLPSRVRLKRLDDFDGGARDVPGRELEARGVLAGKPSAAGGITATMAGTLGAARLKRRQRRAARTCATLLGSQRSAV